MAHVRYVQIEKNVTGVKTFRPVRTPLPPRGLRPCKEREATIVLRLAELNGNRFTYVLLHTDSVWHMECRPHPDPEPSNILLVIRIGGDGTEQGAVHPPHTTLSVTGVIWMHRVIYSRGSSTMHLVFVQNISRRFPRGSTSYDYSTLLFFSREKRDFFYLPNAADSFVVTVA